MRRPGGGSPLVAALAAGLLAGSAAAQEPRVDVDLRIPFATRQIVERSLAGTATAVETGATVVPRDEARAGSIVQLGGSTYGVIALIFVIAANLGTALAGVYATGVGLRQVPAFQSLSWSAVLLTLIALTVGGYAVAVLDRVCGRLVAGEAIGLGDAVVSPFRDAALLLLQHPTRTEHPDPELWLLTPPLLGGLAAAGMIAVPLWPGGLDAESGIVLFGAAMALVMVAVFLHGWSPNAPLPLIGGLGGRVAITVLTLYALLPIIRTTVAGMRSIDPALVEAATSLGMTPRQRLARVELPLAAGSLLLGINQTIVMSLSMVVVAALIGAGGLGYDLMTALRNIKADEGVLAGIAIVFCALIPDRILQASLRKRHRIINQE